MGRLSSSRPAIFVAALALVAALAGTAIAGSDATSAVSKKKVKKIATKQINKLAPGLSVANADTAGNANALGGRPPSAYASSASEPYRRIGAPGQPQFENGWSNFAVSPSETFSRAAFYKDPLGVVHLKGLIGRVPGGTTAFTLPPGYRPSESLSMPLTNSTASDPRPATLGIGTGGAVLPDCDAAGGCLVGIDGLTFRVP